MAVDARGKPQISRMGAMWEVLFGRLPTKAETRVWENALAASDEYFDEVGSDAPCPSCMVRIEHRLVRIA
jgi:hypothetical protein